MKHILFLIAALGHTILLSAQMVSRVEAGVSGDKISVTCMLETARPVDLSLSYSDDEGATFRNCRAVTGDLFRQTGGEKQFVWDCAKDGIAAGRFIFRVDATLSPVIAKRVTSEDVKTSEKTKHKPAAKGGVILMPGISFGNTTSYSLMAGYTDNWGGYGKVKYNFVPKGKYKLKEDDDDNEDGDDDDSDKNYSYKGRFSVTGGVVKRINSYLYAYGGAGYSADWIKDEVEISDESEKGKLSRKGMEVELGVLFKIRKFSVGAGVGYLTKPSAFEGNISLGVIF